MIELTLITRLRHIYQCLLEDADVEQHLATVVGVSPLASHVQWNLLKIIRLLCITDRYRIINYSLNHLHTLYSFFMLPRAPFTQ